MHEIRGNKWKKRLCKWIASLLTVALLVNQSCFSVLAEETREDMTDIIIDDETEASDASEDIDIDTNTESDIEENTESDDEEYADTDDETESFPDDEEESTIEEDVVEFDAENAAIPASEDEGIETYSVGGTFDDGIFTYKIIDEDPLQVEVTGHMDGTDASGDLEILSPVSDGTNVYTVTSIKSEAFRDYIGLTSVIIPDSVTSIGIAAFRDCSSLTSITIPNSVTTIGIATFYNCSSLTSITIPNSVTTIENSTFYNCSSLTSITIPNSVTSIGRDAFQSCGSLTSITIPNSVTSIGRDAFHDCSNLTSITIPNSVTTIETETFWNCSSLTSVTIPDSVTTIGFSAFNACNSLTSVTIPDSVTTIGILAFSACTSLTSLTIPDSVTTIGNLAFFNCNSLTSLTIPDSVTIIGNYAFDNCSSLTSVTILNDNISIREQAFSNCRKLSSFEIALTETENIAVSPTIGTNCFDNCPTDRSLYFLTENGEASLSDTTIPTLAEAVKFYNDVNDGGINDGYWYGWKLPGTVSVPGHSVTIHVNKDGSKWSDCTKKFALSADNGANFINPTDVSNGTYTIYNVSNGTYTIYDITGAPDSTAYTVTVSDSNTEKTIDYYTVTFYNDNAVFDERFVLNNANVSAPSTPPTKDGYTFYKWVTSDGGNTEFKFENPITAKTDIYASWINVEEKPFTIAASAGLGGSVSPSGKIPVKSGDNQQFAITPENGYQITSILVDGSEVFSNGQIVYDSKARITDAENSTKYYVFENVTRDHTLEAYFKAINADDNNGSDASGGGDTGDNNSSSGSGGNNTGDNNSSGSSGGNNTDGNGSSDASGGNDTNDNNNSIDTSSSNNTNDISSPVSISDESVIIDTYITSDTAAASASKENEPKTGDTSYVEIYATIAMIAGLSYLLLYFADGTSGMTENEKKEIVASLVKWAKKGNRFRKYAALAIIFLILVYYHSIGKRTSPEWKEVYEK